MRQEELYDAAVEAEDMASSCADCKKAPEDLIICLECEPGPGRVRCAACAEAHEHEHEHGHELAAASSSTDELAQIVGREIATEAELHGCSVELLAVGYTSDSPGGRVAVYRVGDVLVAGTNGNAVWEDDDEGFATLLEECGIEIDR
jgi:hypothetical protein